MRIVALLTFLLSTAPAFADEACSGAVVEIFGGRMTLPCDYRLLPEIGSAIRFIRFDQNPGRPYGNIYIGNVATLPSSEERQRSAQHLGATLERSKVKGLSVEITRQTARQLLVEGDVTYVSALIHDGKHYVRITDSDSDIWKKLLQRCEGCGQ
jgi:hypothetical protein